MTVPLFLSPWPLAGTDTQGQILLAIQTRLVNYLGWTAERVLLVDPDKLTFHPHGDSYLCIWPDYEEPDRPVFEGASRVDVRLTERILIFCRTRFGVDEATSAADWLFDGTLGHTPLRLSVYNALSGFLPLDSGSNNLSLGPLTPTTGGRPRLEPDEKEWGESILAYDVTYQASVTFPPY